MKVTDILRKSLQALFFPQQCVLCREWVLNADFSPLCRRCFHSLERLPARTCYYCGILVPGSILEHFAACSECRRGGRDFDFARSYGPYEGKLRRLIREFKFQGFCWLAAPLATLLEECYRGCAVDLDPQWIVPVPLHPRRKRERGFDQTLMLSRILSRRLGVPVFRGLVRSRYTSPLFGLDVSERKRVIRGAFALREGPPICGSDVLLLDDVMTTGTTVGEISRLLRQATGVKTIMVLTVARAPLIYC